MTILIQNDIQLFSQQIDIFAVIIYSIIVIIALGMVFNVIFKNKIKRRSKIQRSEGKASNIELNKDKSKHLLKKF